MDERAGKNAVKGWVRRLLGGRARTWVDIQVGEQAGEEDEKACKMTEWSVGSDHADKRAGGWTDIGQRDWQSGGQIGQYMGGLSGGLMNGKTSRLSIGLSGV